MDFFNVSFWQGFLGNLLATIIGVAIGIPIAFWINRRVENATEKEKKKKILSSLLAELSLNQTEIESWREGENSLPRGQIVIGPSVTDDVWNTLSQSDELQWIKDTNLLLVLIEAYGTIKRIKSLSDQMLYLNDFPEFVQKSIVDKLGTVIFGDMSIKLGIDVIKIFLEEK